MILGDTMKVIYVKSCYDCPMCVTDEIDENLCLSKWNDMEMSTEESIISDEIIKSRTIDSGCPLDDCD